MNNENPTVTKNNDNGVSIRDYIDTRFKDVDEKFRDSDVKYQIQFNAAKEALGIALIAQEKDGAKGADSTKEAINKAEIATDKRFELVINKIDGVSELQNRNAGAQGIYVTHTDLNNAFDKFRIDIESVLKPITTKLADVTVYMNSQQGQQKGIDASWTKLVTIIGITATIITLVIKFAV